MLCVLHDRRNVDISRDIPAKCFVQQIVLGSGRQILVAADNVGNTHRMVVNDVCKVISRHAIGFNQNLVVQFRVVDGDIAENLIMEGRGAFLRALLANNVRNAGSQFFCNLFLAQVAAVAVIFGDHAGSGLNLAHLFQTVLVAEAVISMSQLYQLFSICLEHAHPFTLDIRTDRAADIGAFVPVEAGLAQGIVNDIDRTFDITFLVGVLDTQDKSAVMFFGDQVGVQCGTQVTDMHITGRAGCKPGSDGFIVFHRWSLPFLYI